jgi:mono/diheme cytochrome c family protein
MADIQLLGLFHEATPTAETIGRLHELGVPDQNITVMSGIPYQAEMFGRSRPKRRVGLIALIGAILGLVIGLFLTIGIFLLYPLVQGGQPIIPIPPTLIILFETSMLGTMWAAFFGLLGENRFPVFKKRLYDPRITEGHIGVLVETEASLGDKVEKALKDNGAHHMRRESVVEGTDTRLTLFWAGVLGAVILITAGTLLVAYDVTKISFPTNMAEQDSIAYLQGPRLLAPAGAVPIQGAVLIDDQPASEPLPATRDSIQRGEVLFGITCRVCHGQNGDGSSPLSGFFSPKPADLTGDRVQNLSDQELFLVITQGRGIMPSLAENLSPEERWDVVNYVGSIGK